MSITRRLGLAALASLAYCVPALAAWDVGSFKDPLTDRAVTFAKVAAAGTPGATVYVACLNGRVTAELDFSAPVPTNIYSKVGLSYRFDDGPVEPRFALVSGEGHRVYPWLSSGGVSEVRHAKRLRVQLFGRVLDFDLTGADKALGGVSCR